MRSSLRYIIGALILSLLLSPTLTLACGPFTLESIFIFTVHPTYPLDDFARGEIGVVQPSFARSYLYVAYRYLNGGNFSAQEVRSLSQLWTDRLDYGRDLGEDGWIKAWLEARQKITGLSEPAEIHVYRNREKPNEYETFLNCQKDAFANATATLNARRLKFGAESPAVKSWVTAQDQVFSNCSEGQNIPASLDTTDPQDRADRDYQIASANFYATNFDEAIRRFDAIATDERSAWRTTGLYLAARSLVRKASLAAPTEKSGPLNEAESRLNKILSDKQLGSSHAAAARLVDLVRLRLHPSERLHELATKLTDKSQNPSLKQDLWDYTVLLDGVLEADTADKESRIASARTDDLTDWIYTFQSSNSSALSHSLERWKQTKTLPWLIASLSKLSGNDNNAPALIADALKVSTDSEAFPAARFHAVRLLIESGKPDAARSLLDDQAKNHQFDKSTQNLFLSQRMALATSLSDFLKYAPRMPAALSWNDDGREIPAESQQEIDQARAAQGKQFFDIDATTAFNRQLPLSLLKEAAANTSLPTHLRRDVAQAAWLRAVILGDLKTADELEPTLRSLVPELAVPLDEFVSLNQPAAKTFSAIFTWLKFPGLEPVVDLGLGRESPLDKQDSYRDNWWCSAGFSSNPEPPAVEQEESAQSFIATAATPAFLSSDQRAAAAREQAALKAVGAGPNYIVREVIKWANSNPKDPRVPEALHRAVQSTRYGCTDKESGRWSKTAFDLLHRRYPNTTWAAKTKYWFKD